MTERTHADATDTRTALQPERADTPGSGGHQLAATSERLRALAAEATAIGAAMSDEDAVTYLNRLQQSGGQ